MRLGSEIVDQRMCAPFFLIVRAKAVRFYFAQLTPSQIHSQSGWKMEGISVRGAAEARGVKLRFALAQEGCSQTCLD